MPEKAGAYPVKIVIYPCRIHYLGCPAYYACWRDEGLNRVLRTIAEHAKPQIFHLRVLEGFNLLGHLRLSVIHSGDDD